MQKLISIITINYNNKEGLKKTVDSVLEQKNSLFEYIVIDGGSTDGSVEVIQNVSNYITYWVSEKDSGIYNAMNKGIAAATGKYLLFLNSGDCLSFNNIIKQCLEYVVDIPEVDVFYGDIFIIRDGMDKLLKKHPNHLSLQYFKSNTINHQASLIKGDLFKELGFYPENYRLASDYFFYLKLMLNGKVFKYIPVEMIDYDYTGVSSISFEKYKKEMLLIWNALVPHCVKQLIQENEHYQGLLQYKIVKAAIAINNKYQSMK